MIVKRENKNKSGTKKHHLEGLYKLALLYKCHSWLLYVDPKMFIEQATYFDVMADQPVNLPTCQPANLPTCQLANLPICQPANLPTRQPANPPTCPFNK
jgi:hypothetical protein